MANYAIITDLNRCTGCLACLNVCPQDAVVVTQDALGRTVPMIATEKCSGCGRCARICPANSAPVFHPVLQCLAAYSKDEEDRRESSSGGLAAILARRILDDGGVVFGAAYDARRQVAHVEVAARADVACLRGNMPPSIMSAGTPDDVRSYAKKLIDVVGEGGGYIMGCATSITDAKEENVRTLFDYTREHGRY